MKKFLLAGILLLLLLPTLQQKLRFWESDKLKGAIVPVQKLSLSLDALWEGTYQESYTSWYNENFGFRPDFVRLRNQIVYSLFGVAKANGVIIGKEGFLYEKGYIDTKNGKDFIGIANINELATKIKAIQDSLEARNITLLVCFAAGKASYYPEYIPDEFGSGVDSTNYTMMSAAFAANGINNIDFNKWIMGMKTEAKYPLFPKTGIHWSRYATLLAMDSLIKYVEYKQQVDLPNVIWKSIEVSDSLRSPDGDIGEAMNLIWPIAHFANMGYPSFDYEDTTGKAKVSMMTISDSFFWSMFDSYLAPNCFSNIDFYYYFKEVYHSSGGPMTVIDPIAATANVSKHQVVVLMATESNLSGIGWGFVNGAHEFFVEHKAVEPMKVRISAIEAGIRTDQVWMEAIKVKAEQHGISVDSMVYLDAVYMAEQELK